MARLERWAGFRSMPSLAVALNKLENSMRINPARVTRRCTSIAPLTLAAALLAAPTASRADIMYVFADYGIERFDTATGADLGLFASFGLNDPGGMAFDSAGNLYVSHTVNNTIEKFTPEGVRSVFVSSGLSQPTGLACDSAGNLYVAHSGSFVQEFSPSGANLGVFAQLQTTWIDGLAFDKAGNLYVGNACEKFSPTGADLGRFATGISLSYTAALAFDSDGNLYLSNYDEVSKFSPGGPPLAQLLRA